jgi:hypothetical protein
LSLALAYCAFGGARRFLGLARVDAHQHFTFFDALPGIGLDFDDAAGDLRADRGLLHRLDQRLGRECQVDRMRLHGNGSQLLRLSCWLCTRYGCGQRQK